MIDTHAHLNLAEFDQDRDGMMTACREMELEVINVGIDRSSSVKAIELAQNPGFYASVGVHPGSDPELIQNCQDLLNQPKVVAIGETGLDFLRFPDDLNEHQRQQELFEEHGRLAAEHNLPLIIHCRKAYRQLISLLSLEMKGLPGVIHSFSGGLSEARELLDLGYYLGFSGLIFKLELSEVIKSTPLERILIETDSPYLAPPSLNQKRNTPQSGWRIVLEKVASIKQIPAQEVVQITDQNAYHLFQLEKHGGIPIS